MTTEQLTPNFAEPQEIWKPIPGYEGRYEVSNLGQVRSFINKNNKIKTPRILRQGTQWVGYKYIRLHENGKCRSHMTHRLVLLAFVGPCPEGMEVNHIGHDGDKTNNYLGNLEYVTHTENMINAIKNGLAPCGDRNGSRIHPESRPRGSKVHTAKLREFDIPKIKDLLSIGTSQKVIAKLFHVSTPTISHIKHGTTWKHV